MKKALLLIYLIWGLNWVVMKTANQFFPPIEFVFYRFFFGAIILTIVAAFLRVGLPEKKHWPWICITGILQTSLANCLLQTSMLNLTAGTVSVLNYSSPVWVALMAHFILKDKLTLRKGLGIICSVTGMAILMGIQNSSGSFFAVVLALLSGIVWASSTIIFKLKLTNVNTVQLTTGQMISGAAAVGIYTLIFPQGEIIWNTSSILCIAYNGILASALCFFLWSYVLTRMEAAKAATAILAVPVVGIIGGVLLIGEPLTLNMIVGMAIILTGIYTVVSEKSAKLRK